MTTLAPPTTILEGERVRLVPLQMAHLDGLWDAAQFPEIWTYMPVRMQTKEDMVASIALTLRQQALGLELPFTVIDQDTKRIVGSTRFLDVTLAHRGLEIGWTWYTPNVWRTRINTECKYLLLTYAFETLKVLRVCLKTDARNVRSQQAITRLGAVREGVLRAHRILPDGFVRDTVYFSILAAEWPAIKLSLENALSSSHAER